MDSMLNSTFLSPASAAVFLLFANATMMAGGAGYKPGVNGVPPVMITLKGKNLYHTIYLNVLNGSFVKSLHEVKQMAASTLGFPERNKGEISAEKISLQTGLLWRSRELFLIPRHIEQAEICSISGQQTHIVIQNIFFKPQTVSLKKETYWYDPMIIKSDLGAKGLKKITAQRYELPSWKEYPSLININGRNTKKRILFAPLNVQQISKIQLEIERLSVRLSILSLATDNKAKIFQISEQDYFFHSKFVDDPQFISVIEHFVQSIEEFEWRIKLSLKIANNIRAGSNAKPALFESSFWHEIGSNFEQALERLSSEDDVNLIQNDWNEMLAEHVRATFRKHTDKLIQNAKNLQPYTKAHQFLESAIRNMLLKHKKEEAA